MLKKYELHLLLLIVLIGLATRLYRVTNPLLDWHAWRQADTASVTREYVKNGIDPLHPQYHDLSTIPTGGIDNLNGWRMVEFPVMHLITAPVLIALPQLPLEQTSRVVSILFSLLGLVSLYGITKSISGKKVAMAAALVYAVLPFSVYYGRVVLPEPALIGVILLSIYAFQSWLTTKKLRWYILSFACLAIAFLLKPYAIFFAPVFVALAYIALSWKMFLNPWLWLLALSSLPMFWWRNWITQFPEGIPGSEWLLNGNDIRFKPAWVRWIFFERLHRLILGSIGSILIVANVLKLSTKELIVYTAWWLGMLAYVTIFATGNVQHDYYQALLIPIVAITLGRGSVVLYNSLASTTASLKRILLFAALLLLLIVYASTLAFGYQLSGFYPENILGEFWWFAGTSAVVVGVLLWQRRTKRHSPLLAAIVLVGLWIGALSFSWQYVSGFFNVNSWQSLRAGQALQAVAASDALVIAPYMGDTQLLFQTSRRGWPIGGGIDEKIAKGADYYVSTHFDNETNELIERFSVVTQTHEFVVIDLNAPRETQ